MSTSAYAQLVDTESEPQEAPSEIEELQSLGSRVPFMGKEFETVEPSARHAPVHLARVTKAMALSDSAFRKRYRSFYETPLPSPSLTLPVRKRYRGISELILDTDSEGDELGNEEDESSDADDEREREREEEVIPEGQQQAVLVVETVVTKPLGLDYEALRRCELAVKEDHVPSTFEVAYAPPTTPVQTMPSLEWSLGSLPFLPSSFIVPSPIASPVATPTATISVDEDQFIEVGAQLELYESILQDHTQRLDALPPTFIADIDKDERTVMAFGALWRPVLALEAWAGHVDTRLADMSRTRRGIVESSRWYEIG
nr:hypothetical protein [Tanacetum cinerariifolium]